MKPVKPYAYAGAQTREISFPLGGIGSGSIGIDGQGRLIDWEIFNRPNKQSLNGFSFLLARAEKEGEVVDARVLNGPLQTPYTGNGGGKYTGYGFGPPRGTLAGIPHFEENTFEGPYPIASLGFHDSAFPGDVTLRAFNPFIPLNEDDSSLPAAFFEVTARNTSPDTLTYSFITSVNNPHGKGRVHRQEVGSGMRAIVLGSDAHGADDTAYGSVCVATDASQGGAQDYWYRGVWFDNLSMFWRDVMTPGPIKNREYPTSGEGGDDVASLEGRITVAPGQTGTVRFIISWYYPNCTNYWDEGANRTADTLPNRWKNWYATKYTSAEDVARYGLAEYGRLLSATEAFRDSLTGSTLPHAAIDAITANISILKSPTALRLEDGSFYGWEGLHKDEGSCEGTCAHVWNYAYAMTYLFPRLERSIRELDYRYNLKPSGSMSFRLQLPLGRDPWSFRACCDGQFGSIIKVYREWRMLGDIHWLKELWPGVKKSVEFAWSPENPDRWDPDKSGVLTGRQHHTLDMELYGPNAWLGGFYLAALKAAAIMADAVGDHDAAQEYMAIFKRGKAFTDSELFNGEYYYHKLDLSDKEMLKPYAGKVDTIHGGDAISAYWNDEIDELKYQIGEGCSIDQVLAQWHASLMGLGEIFDHEQTLRALSSIYRYNYVKSGMGRIFNPCRLYSLEDEGGTIICSYPEGRKRPVISAPYAEETFHGMEYQAASHMIMEGMVEEGMDIVKAVRARYDGERRNPWNEIECGSNYARSMASFALLPAFSGFRADNVDGVITINPVYIKGGIFRAPFYMEGAWGIIEVDADNLSIRVMDGALRLNALHLPFMDEATGVSVDGQHIPFTFSSGALIFAAETVCASSLVIAYK